VAGADEPILVTTARRSPGAERRDRERRYLITMAIRVVCFILAIVLFAVGIHWAAGVAAALSLILPWVAVVMANSGPGREDAAQPRLYRRERAELEADRDGH
jgi:hypothetical protein